METSNAKGCCQIELSLELSLTVGMTTKNEYKKKKYDKQWHKLDAKDMAHKQNLMNELRVSSEYSACVCPLSMTLFTWHSQPERKRVSLEGDGLAYNFFRGETSSKLKSSERETIKTSQWTWQFDKSAELKPDRLLLSALGCRTDQKPGSHGWTGEQEASEDTMLSKIRSKSDQWWNALGQEWDKNNQLHVYRSVCSLMRKIEVYFLT